MEFRILGPVELHGEQGPVPLGGRRERVLLALLLLAPNRRVTADELIEGLWGEPPPPTAPTALQGAVSRLRKLLSAAGGDGRQLLLTQPGGYLLRLEADQLDLERFERLFDEGRQALAGGRPDLAGPLLREALDLWRGPPLADLRYEGFAQAEIKRLEELRLAALEDRIEADLALGGHAEVVGELEALVREHPLRERLRAHLMLALYRSGRQADALAAYQQARATLVDELGIEPGPELRELNRRILNQDESLVVRSTTAALPTGTVTLLASDVEGSTRLVRQLGDRYPELLGEVQRRLREAFRGESGREVDSQGDSFLYAFASTRAALRAAAVAQRACDAQGWPQGADVRVRIGVHTGEPALVDGRYVGLDVHRVSRICAAAHGGQVLASSGTAKLVGDLPDGLELRDVGEQRLKDLADRERLYQLVIPGLTQEFPPPRGLHATNVPRPATRFVGRKRALVKLHTLLLAPDARLVTLTGPGGSGKSRLALELGAELLPAFRDGVFLVPLAAVSDPALVLPTIAQTLSVKEVASEPLAETLAHSLSEKEILLLVDNFEQVLPAAPGLSFLLERTSALKILVTSRAALRLSLERRFEVPPLALPDVTSRGSLEALLENEAVALFCERARAVNARFEPTTENAAAIADICVRLDGLPLALELAAARANALSPAALLARLGKPFALLTAGARDRPERHQTLRAAIDWSHGLLDEPEQALFRRLAVFTGGWTLEAAEGVCDPDGGLEAALLERLDSLVEKSLVYRPEGADADPRFSMLETIRHYALERLDESGEAETVRLAHGRYFVELAEAAYRRRLADEQAWAAKLEREHDNLRSALEWLRSADPPKHVQLAGALAWFWNARSHLAEGRERLAEALDHAGERAPHVARALAGAALLETWQGATEAAIEHLEQARAIWRELGDRFEEALALDALAYARLVAGDIEGGRRDAEEHLALRRELGPPELLNRARTVLALCLIAEGEAERAEPLAAEVLAAALAQGDVRRQNEAYHLLGDCALMQGRCELAEARYGAALRAAWQLGDRAQASVDLEGVAMAVAGRGEPELGLRLAGAAGAALDALGVDMSVFAFWTSFRDRYLGRARSALGARADAVWEEGRRLSLMRAVDLGLDLVEARSPDVASAPPAS